MQFSQYLCKGQYPFSFENFVTQTLKKAGPQTISQHWYLPEANVQGDLHNVLINNLNLIADVVRFDIPLNEITAPKTIAAANISKLYVTSESQVNNIYVANWISETVFVYGNHTIYGNTVLDSVNIYNNINVDGTVNNIIFDENTLLLVDHEQVVHGPVIIRNKFPAAQRILTNNIENLQTEMINGWNVEEFYRNQIKFNHTVNIQGSLVFTKPLMVAEYRTGEDLEREKRNTNITTAYKINASSVQADHNFILDDFEIRQVINISATKILALPVQIYEDIMDVIAIISENSKEGLHFYNWNISVQQYLLNSSLSRFLNEPIEILDMVLKKDKYIWFVDHKGKPGINQMDKDIANDMESLKAIQQINVDNKWQIERFQMRNNGDCFALYSYESDRSLLYCLEKFKITKKTQIIKPKIKQILALSVDIIATLSDESVDIWNTSLTKRSKQHFAVYKAKQMTACIKNKYLYLAVISKAGENSLQNGIVQIYRSTNNSFHYMQTIYSDYPTQIEFALIPESDDLLLYALSESLGHSLIIYQYKGIAGFVQIVSRTILNQAVYMQALHLSSGNHLVALLSINKVTFIEVMLKNIV